jgi:hypothetical protein
MFFFLVLSEGTQWHPQKFLQYSKYMILVSPWFFFIFSHLTTEIVSTSLIFPFMYVYTVFARMHPPTPFPQLFWTLNGTTPLRQDLFLFLPPFLWLCGKKKMLSFVQDTTQRVCLWQFCVYMYYNAKWFISIIFLLSILDPLLMVISSSLKILYSFLYREYIYHINLFNFLLYTPSFICYHPLVWPFFHNIAVFVLGLYSTYERKHATFDLLNLDNFP